MGETASRAKNWGGTEGKGGCQGVKRVPNRDDESRNSWWRVRETSPEHCELALVDYAAA